MTTMIVFTSADSLAPRTSSSVQSTTSTTAGRLIRPVGSCSNGIGENERASGIWVPMVLASSSLK